MFNRILDSINHSGHINLFNGMILFIGFAIAITLVGIYTYKSDKEE